MKLKEEEPASLSLSGVLKDKETRFLNADTVNSITNRHCWLKSGYKMSLKGKHSKWKTVLLFGKITTESGIFVPPILIKTLGKRKDTGLSVH